MLKWFTSYLNLRSQCVLIKDCKSKDQQLLYGVPQGSVLGPILFSLYVSPLTDIIRKHHVNFHTYADDVQIYISFTPSSESSSSALQTLENCVSDVRHWMYKNKLKLNDTKTEAVLFGRKCHASHLSFDAVTVGDCQTTFSNSARDLGIILDSELSMKDQVSTVCQSCFYHLRNISRIRKYLTQTATESLVHALIGSRLDYGNSLLCGIPKSSIRRLQSVQNAAARVVIRSSRFDHITPVLFDLHWLPVQSRILFKILLLTYKALHGLAPSYVKDLLKVYVPSRTLRSSDDFLLCVPKSRLVSCGDRAFSSSAPRLWNSLPRDIRMSASLTLFRRSLKTYLFKDAYVS